MGDNGSKEDEVQRADDSAPNPQPPLPKEPQQPSLPASGTPTGRKSASGTEGRGRVKQQYIKRPRIPTNNGQKLHIGGNETRRDYGGRKRSSGSSSSNGDVMQIMAVYGFPEERFKARTWDLVRRAKPPHPMPWLCIGDFNDIISPADKLGGDVPDMGRLQVANQACNECDFHDVGFSGYRFTWSNMREAPNTVEERLDFALANSAWSCMWPVTKVRHLINYKSDHCPIVLTFSSRRGHRELARTKLFRFEELWLQSSDECSEVVAEAWSRTWSGDDLHGKFEAVSGALGSWGKQKFGDIPKKISDLKVRLQNLQRKPKTDGILREMREAERELDVLLEREEIWWSQRSRANWLKHGHRNTRFFHQKASQRRKRNLIEVITDRGGREVEDDAQISQVLREYFESLFTSSNPSGIEEVTSLVAGRVTQSHLVTLGDPFTKEEVEEAVFQMHPTKALDDSIIFAKATDQEAEVVKTILATYESASGQMINLDKSMLSVSRNVPQNRLYELKQLLGVKAVESFDRYLGLPTIFGALDGTYSSKLGYSFIRNHEAQTNTSASIAMSPLPAKLWQIFWKTPALPRCKDLAWRICCSLLPVRDSLWRKGVNIDPSCPLCGHESETFLEDVDSDAVASWQTTSYALWEARNKLVFQEVPFRCEAAIQRAASMSQVDASIEVRDPHGPVRDAIWRRPPRGFFKVNFDGSWKADAVSGMGMVARNHDGLVLAAAAEVVERPSTVVEAEALAFRWAIGLAINFGFRRVCFETDCLTLFQMWKKPPDGRNYLATIFSDCFQLCRSLDLVSVVFVRRSGNVVADFLARNAASYAGLVWIEEVPPEVDVFVTADLLASMPPI
ncbi:uncharacterized protein LOC130721452 [Lotus japonicus]|uniref:uncharacterized protein LOC130721452 n=1 Tax=Lotus japonicus TaxID=34305 RepID=UPI0025903061|nr:uncharacterized protein LOC130721452 [Lotus japonicus]